LPPRRVVEIHTDNIALGALLKWAGITPTGGEAKQLIAARRVLVNGQIELRRGRRLAGGDVVAVHGGPTIVISKAIDAATPPALAPRLS
jgi:ribosome-associated protein